MKLLTEIKIAMTDNISEDMRDLLSRCHERITLLESALESELETKTYLLERISELRKLNDED